MYSFVADSSKVNPPHCPKIGNAREIPLGISTAMNLYILLCAGFFIQPRTCKDALSEAMIACEPLANSIFRFRRSLCDFESRNNPHKKSLAPIPSAADQDETFESVKIFGRILRSFVRSLSIEHSTCALVFRFQFRC